MTRINNFQSLSTMMKHRRSGFTLIEVVIVLAVIAILAGILVPVIGNNIRSARLARAGSDTAAIGKAMVQMRQDSGLWPIYKGTTPVQLLFGDMDSDNDGIPDNSEIPNGWHTVPTASRLSLYVHLSTYNLAAFSVNNGPSAQGLPSWNGPYLAEIKLDPWGSPYVVNSQWLWPGNTGNVYVLSAGPVRPATVDTPFGGSNVADTNDITFRVQ